MAAATHIAAAMQPFVEHVRFASDAELLLFVALGLLAVAGLAIYAERRRLRRNAIDRVGFMPWTLVFFIAAFAGAGLGAAAVKGMLAG